MQQLNLIQEEKPTITLRPYQITAKKSLYQAIKDGKKRIMVNAPCGWGKCFFAVSIAADVVVKGKKVLFVVPYRTLVKQAIDSFNVFGLTYGVIAGGYEEDRSESIQIATIQTLAIRNIDWFKYDVLILDECHILAFSTWFKSLVPPLYQGKELISAYDLKEPLFELGFYLDFVPNPSWKDVKEKWAKIKFEANENERIAYKTIQKYPQLLDNPKRPNEKIIIGLTGSPWRLSKIEKMSDLFDAQVKAETPKQMAEMGMLSPCIYYHIKGIKTEGLNIVKGDFDVKQLEEACTSKESVRSIVENYLKLGKDRTFVCFAVTVKHANLLTAEFNSQGVTASVVTAETPDKERAILFQSLEQKTIQGLVSVGVLSVGFDVPNIGCVISCRPTLSQSLYVQQLGRGMRIAEGKEDCLVLDQAGNLKRFGPIEDIKYPDLEDQTIKADKPVEIKICDCCDRINYLFAKVCEGCGFEFPKGEGSKKEAAVGELTLYVAPELKDFCDEYRANLKKAYQTQKMPEWAYMQLASKGFKVIPREWARGAIFGLKPETPDDVRLNKMDTYLRYLSKVATDRIARSNGVDSHKFDLRWIERNFYGEFGVRPHTELLSRHPYCRRLLDVGN